MTNATRDHDPDRVLHPKSVVLAEDEKTWLCRYENYTAAHDERQPVNHVLGR